MTKALAIARAEHRGFAHLAPGATAQQPLGWSSCGQQRRLNINTELRVNPGTAGPKSAISFLSMAQTDGGVHTTYRLSWQRCS